jgi:membrane dipeptidase
LVASHSNVHALCQHSRNLTDRQLDDIRDTGRLVGINFGVLFLREDGIKDPNTGLDALVRYVTCIADRIGIDHVALGSDFDGRTVPACLKHAADLQRLVQVLRAHALDEQAMSKVANQNWIDVLHRPWGA